MNMLFTVCARAGSKGVAGKNVRLFCGKPLVYYTLEIYEKFLKKFQKAQDSIEMAVNTDSKQLLMQIEEKGTNFIFVERKKELAGDIVAKRDVIEDTLIEAERVNKKKYDLVIDLDLTSPLRNLKDIEGTIAQVVQNEKCNFAYSVVESRRNPYFNMVKRNESGYYDRVISSEYTARQQLPECFDMNASIYVYTRDFLLNSCENKGFALVWKMQDSVVLDIDSENDFEIMELLVRYYWNQGRYLDIRDN